jgi:hypothetical protein
VPRVPGVLVLTGGVLTAAEGSVAMAVRKQLLQWRASRSAWLDLQVKLVGAEPIVAVRADRRRLRRDMAPQPAFHPAGVPA